MPDTLIRYTTHSPEQQAGGIPRGHLFRIVKPEATSVSHARIMPTNEKINRPNVKFVPLNGSVRGPTIGFDQAKGTVVTPNAALKRIDRGILRPTTPLTAASMIIAASFAVAALAPSAYCQSCNPMQDLGTLGTGGSASGVSANGNVVVGETFYNESGHAFRWTAAGGMQDLGTLGGTVSQGVGVSADGNVVVGRSHDAAGFFRAFRWTAAGGMQDLGTLGGAVSAAHEVSADGTVVVGLAAIATGAGRAFRWTAAGGMQDLGTFGGNHSDAYGVSADGNVVVGRSLIAPGVFRAFRWTAAGGMQDLGTLGGNQSGAYGVSADGNVVVGYAKIASNQLRAFRWTAAGGMQDLGTLGGDDSGALGASADGSVVVGTAGSQAFRWTAAGGMQDLGTLGGNVAYAAGVSPDGSVVVGGSVTAAGSGRPFRWRSPSLLLFRESDNGSWGWGPDAIPGWDHVGLFHNGVVYESHPPYDPCELGYRYFDPNIQQYLTIAPDDGVQWQHSKGSYQHDSCDASTTAGNLELPVPCEYAAGMASFIESRSSATFRYFNCESSWITPTCLRDNLSPFLQKGGVGALGPFTCVGLVEKAAEVSGMNGGQGFIPDAHESFHVPLYGDLPCLSPKVLSWYAENGFDFADGGALCGLFDPVDFVLTDPAGHRLGHTAVLGTLNEIPGALYSGDGALEQFLIPNPIAGQYQLQLVGIGGEVGAAIGGIVTGQLFEGHLAFAETHNISIVVPTLCDSIDFNNDTSLFDPQDIEAFLSVYSEGPCVPATATCGDIDFNDDTSLFDPCDINSFLLMYSEGPCTPCGV